MKAEHRKELETNTLAEGMGHLVQRIKERPRRNTFGYVLVGVAAGIVLILALRYSHMSRQDAADRWAALEDGRKQRLEELIRSAPDSNAGKAARLERSWINFWEDGMRALGRNPKLAFMQLDKAFKDYEEAAKLCEGDPTFEPEALYAMAVIEETRAIEDRKHLDSARDMYEKLATKYDSSAFGKMAGERVATLKDDKKRTELVQFYQNLSSQLGLDRAEPKAKADAIPGLIPPLPPVK
jgi:hypothetical protein